MLWINWMGRKIIKMKKKIFFMIVILCIGVMVVGCSNVGEFKSSSEHSSGLDFGCEKKQQTKNKEDMSLVWRIVSIPKDGDVKLNMELPFEFEDLRKFKDLDEVKNRETFIHKEDKSMVMINHGVITNPNKKMIFPMNTFADLIKGAKEKKLIKSEKRNINGQDVVYLVCEGRTEKDESVCIMEFIGVQVDGDYWMISYVYYADDNAMAEIAKRSIESIQIK